MGIEVSLRILPFQIQMRNYRNHLAVNRMTRKEVKGFVSSAADSMACIYWLDVRVLVPSDLTAGRDQPLRKVLGTTVPNTHPNTKVGSDWRM
jgi:hypothetical protein